LEGVVGDWNPSGSDATTGLGLDRAMVKTYNDASPVLPQKWEDVNEDGIMATLLYFHANKLTVSPTLCNNPTDRCTVKGMLLDKKTASAGYDSMKWLGCK
jgi:hypothetical protein